MDLVDEGADDKTVRKYLYEKFHYLKKNVKLTDEQKQAKRRKGRLDKVNTRLIGLII